MTLRSSVADGTSGSGVRFWVKMCDLGGKGNAEIGYFVAAIILEILI